ncbi:hypothetical protein [Acinetobacter baumannii]|uniref:hypothetical protein n=1 Tax=Acinetobacter baumannii TaxID=470 RepID=UPI00259F7795|nr:hypothetical protein [Acinetobacter baumannii]EKU7083966.1 hypothetical protein [Acinetobacter baumannii]EKV1039803.1 hypothetical protein [Acinetobacter baumannii]EKV3703282.1 hypothetical protein [Acinetobacter baumannii]EKV3732532.1 hypothetical protein [Acinetobacter baumannii]EKV3808789.1 hypothetical protein [Acinetobacter baumannii]
MAQLAPMMQLRARFEDKCGHPLAGGNVFAFEAGTSTPKDTFADADGTIPNTHPIKLDSRGEADIFLLTGRYRFVVYSCFGVKIYDVDDVGDWFGTISADNVIDGDKSQHDLNKLIDYKSTPEYYRLISDVDDIPMFQRLVATNPSKIILQPGKTYDLKNYTAVLQKSCVIEGNHAIVKVSGTNVGFTPKPMVRSKITALAAKGDFDVYVTDASLFSVGDKIHIYIGADTTLAPDPYYESIQYDETDVGYTGQLNVVAAVDLATNKVTLKNKLLYKTSDKGYLQKIYDDVFKFKDFSLQHDGLTSSNLFYNYVCNLFSNIKVINPDGGLKGLSPNQSFNSIKLIHQSSFNCHYVGAYFGKATCVHFNHGTINFSVWKSHFDAQFRTDGALVMYAGPVNGLSYKNTFLWHSFKFNDVEVIDAAGVYFGAKCRDCTSNFDNLNGFYNAFRGYFGSYNAKILNPVLENSKGSTMQMVGGFDLLVQGGWFDYPAYTRFCPRSKILDNDFLSSWVDGSTDMINAFQVFPKATNVLDNMESITIIGNRFRGNLSISVGLNKGDIVDNDAALISLYSTSASVNKTKISDNRVGGINIRRSFDVDIFNNTIDDTPLRNLTTKRLGGIQTSGEVVGRAYNNTIIAESVGIYNETANRSLDNALQDFNNNINAPTKVRMNLNLTTNTPVLNAANKALVGSGALFSIDSSEYKWKLKSFDSAAEFVKADRNGNETYSYSLSFTPVANGIYSAGPRTVKGVLVGDQVLITCPTLSPSDGEFIAKVTNTDVVQIYYRNFTASTAAISHTVYVTVVK